MKLLTKEIMEAFKKQGRCDEKKPEDTKIIVKFFNPCGAAIWYATEYDEENRTFFGWANLGDDECAELGYFSLDELQSIKCPPFGLGIERDLHLGDHNLAEVMNGKRI